MITTAGKNSVRNFLINDTPSSYDSVAVGTDGTVALVTQTALGALDYGESATKSEPSTFRVLFDMDFGTGDGTSGAVYKEIGLFTSSDGTGTMLSRLVITNTPNSVGVAYRFQYDIRVTWV